MHEKLKPNGSSTSVMGSSRSNEWDRLADESDENRKSPSATMAIFRDHVHGTVLDAGCGNGRNSLEIAKTADRVIAMDASEAMLAKTRLNTAGNDKIEVLRGRIQAIPLQDGAVDAIYCLAALHHLKPKDHDRAAVEFFRILKAGGSLCLTVWNRQQARFRNKPKEQNVPWEGKPRYYYLFDEGELAALLKEAGFRLEKTIYEKSGRNALPQDAQNLCIVARKPKAP